MVEPVKIHVANQKGFVWDINDVQTLRIHHHICGVLSGTLPEMGQQNVFLGLPLILLPEEVVLLVRHKLAVLISQPAAHLAPTLAQATTAAAEREADIHRQRKEYKDWTEQKALQVKQKFAAQIEAKRKERQSARASNPAPAADSDLATFSVQVPAIPQGQETTPPPAAVAPAARSDNLDSIAYTITIQPSSTDLPWYDTDAPGARFETLEEAATAGVWNYPEPGPRQILQESRCRVFEELWRKGHYLGVGLRFGGDFLVYPGDPLRYHSHFTLTVLATPVSAIMPLDLVAYGRLATAVKKAHLLASWDDQAQQAEFFSLEWAAFG